jgi:hypothetical protein
VKEILAGTISISFLDRHAVKIAAIKTAPKRLHAILKNFLIGLSLIAIQFNEITIRDPV